MDLSKLRGYEAACKAVNANMTPRALSMAELERWVEGSQYNDRGSWWNDEIPLQDRAPCIVYPAVSNAIRSNVDLVLGEGRFPGLTTRPGEDEGDDAEENALDEDASATVDRLIGEIAKQARFRIAMREMLSQAQGVGSACAIGGIRARKLRLETVKARWCEPLLNNDRAVEALNIQYPYLEPYREQDGTWCVRAMLFKREISAEFDLTYAKAEARTDGIEPDWVVDSSRSIRHGLGFCPVIWYEFMRGVPVEGTIDGHAIHADYLDEIEAHDFALSQRHRAALYSGDPQWTEIGVEPGTNPSAPGRAAGVPGTAKGGSASTDNPITSRYVDANQRGRGGRRRKGAGQVWQYESPDAKVEQHCLPGDALKALTEHAADVRAKLCEALAVVFLDPDSIKFASTTSGKALETLRMRQFDRCDQIRDDCGDSMVIPSMQMLLRIAAQRPKDIDVPGLKRALGILSKLNARSAANAAA